MKGRKWWWIALTAFLLKLLLDIGPAAAGTVNFDNLPTPGPNPLKTAGATFSATSLAVTGNPTSAVTPPNVLSCTSSYNLSVIGISDYPIFSITFDTPQFYVSFHELSFQMGLSVEVTAAPVVNAIVARAFDVNGNVVDQDRLFFTGGAGINFSGDRRIILSANGIKSVVFIATLSNISSTGVMQLTSLIDNLAFCAAPRVAVIPLN
jgi:hypothetical protein